MKRKFIKSLILTLGFMSVLNTTGFASPISLDNQNRHTTLEAAKVTQNNQTIPPYMKPGSVIQYDSNNKMIIVKYGVKYKPKKKSTTFVKNNIKKNYNLPPVNGKIIYKPTNDEFYLPSPCPGMRVAYDGMGRPSIIKGNKNTVQRVRRASKPNLQGEYVYGKFTWYEDKIGEADHKLGQTDCATKQGFDEPPVGTEIIATDRDTGLSARLYKWDVGKLPKAVLDIRPYAFADVFQRDLEDGEIEKGQYIHY